MSNIRTLTALLALLFLASCGGEEADYESYTPAEHQVTLMSTDMEEVELFTSDDKSLYIYFTGVG